MKNFLSFVEIQTKLATLLPFFAALALSFYQQGHIRYLNMFSTGLYVVAALFLDMAVTAINNHLDAREEKTRPHYSPMVGGGIILSMLVLAAAIGIFLVYIHGLTLLLAGAFCFFIGIIYTFGPMPISKSTYGEFFSGFTVGPVVMFIVMYINNPDFAPVAFELLFLDGLHLTVDVDIIGLILFGIVTLPAAFAASNILLANNICDREKDRAFRYTLVHSIGLKNSLRLFCVLYYLIYVAIGLGVILGQLPLLSLLTLLTIFPVQKGIGLFLRKQVKAETFAISVKNFVIILVVYAASIGGGRLLERLWGGLF